MFATATANPNLTTSVGSGAVINVAGSINLDSTYNWDLQTSSPIANTISARAQAPFSLGIAAGQGAACKRGLESRNQQHGWRRRKPDGRE